MNGDRLFEELRAIAARLERDSIRLIVAGGYGLLLREMQLRAAGREPRRPFGAERSTDDLDFMLDASIISNGDQTRLIREALDELGYVPAPGRENYQFLEGERLARKERGIKIDFLAPPVPAELVPLVKTDTGRDVRRIRPRSFSGLHAHLTPEALTIAEHALEVPLGERGTGPIVLVPHPYSHILLKLFALRDRMWEGGRADFGRYHAFDIYRILALINRDEWREAEAIAAKYRDEPAIRTANRYVSVLFADDRAPGARRLADFATAKGIGVAPEHVRATVDDLAALFPATNAAPLPAGDGPATSGFEAAGALDDAKALLVASLDRWAEANKDTPGHRTAEELRNRVSPLITAARDLPAALLTEETWERGARWASRRAADGPDTIRALVEALSNPTGDPGSS